MGALARLIYIFVLHPATQHIYSDMQGYVYRARRLFTATQTIADSIYPPGASVLFGILYRLDPSWMLCEIVQWLLSLGSMALIWSLARRFYGNQVAVVALAMAAAYFPFIHYAALFLAENPFMFFMLLTLRLFVRAIDAGTRRNAIIWAVIAGIAAGLATSFKTTILGPMAISGLLYAAYSIKHRLPYLVPISLALICGAALLFVPMSVHCTHLTEGHLCIAATNGPMNILQGHYGDKFMFHWHDDVRHIYFDFGSPTASLRGFNEAVWLNFGAYDSAANMQLVRQYITAHPWAALMQSFRNVTDLFTGRSFWPDPRLWGIDWGAVYQVLYWVFILPAAAIHLGIRWRPILKLDRESLPDWLLLGSLLGVALLAFIGEGEVRFRIPFDGLPLILAACCYVEAGSYLRTQWRNAGSPPLAGAPQ